MKRLRGKKIVLGISAGIAAYKIPSLVRLLKKEGASVRVILTPDAHAFVTPLTLSVLSQEAVLSSFVSEDTDNPVWNDHVALGNWADLMLIAPATANSLSAMAHAKCNNLLIATYLSARCPVMIAPAMDLDMYAHPANQKNIETLETYGNIVLPVGDGALASGLEGKGRMLEPQEILEHTIHHFYSQQPLLGKKVLITAGPTYEPLDPVRFIGNFSSGKMGYALAHQAADLGAEVHLILGPHSLDTDEAPFTIEEINTADEMHAAVFNRYHMMDFAIAAAAVADFKPRTLASQKIKKEIGTPAIELIPNPDILAQMGEQKKNQVLIGFALETENEVAHATNKLKRKNLDAIILNSLADAGAGFATDTNKITYIGKNEAPKSFSLKSKEEVAKDIWNEILT
ncbi:MAG: bifunctional phosphopantothenoylcysteine decarboxylase/phosphopantothenate--cysteine ligase CoaBC [Flavobacteriaceae bacterium]|nr:bifunctional phosphopantothenoylcysteine decarboxylase/phosphopantothenate--cysteine ligase CoaBC [Flavobacteriaceae bacterium]